MMPVVNCPKCRKPLRLPAGAQSIWYTTCNAVSRIPNAIPPLALLPPCLRLVPFLLRSTNAIPPLALLPPCLRLVPFLLRSTTAPNRRSQFDGRAVICAISYRDSCYELEGCIKDAKYMKNLLVNRFNFPESSILMLTETDPSKIPTTCNLRRPMTWLVLGCQPGDSLVFHFSGHGSQICDIDGDVVDGYDETLYALDFETEGMLVDDKLNATLVRRLPCGPRLPAIIDCCHNGMVLDLPFVCRMGSNGRTIFSHQVSGKEQMVVRLFQLVAVMIMRTLQILSVISCPSLSFNPFVVLVSCPWFLVSKNSLLWNSTS
ncbi:Metacaspase-1 [Nymphaea thermarum]|nr:Metacaspase-1 [Nymphaea thermarum]